MTTSARRHNPPARDIAAIGEAMRHLVSSAEPAVVLSSLARLSVPVFSDACLITVEEGDDARYRIAYPHLDAHGRPPADQDGNGITVDIRSVDGAETVYCASIRHTWHEREPDDLDVFLARSGADRVADAIRYEQSADDASQLRNSVVNLERALQTSRDIGTAVGVLMAQRRITSTAAFDLMRTASQATQRKLVDIAADVVDTGWLDAPATPVGPSARAVRRRGPRP